MLVEKCVTAARTQAVDKSKECRRRSLRYIGFMLSYGVVFILLSVLVPGISKEHQIMCWQNAAAAFAMTMYLTWMHLTVHKTELPPV